MLVYLRSDSRSLLNRSEMTAEAERRQGKIFSDVPKLSLLAQLLLSRETSKIVCDICSLASHRRTHRFPCLTPPSASRMFQLNWEDINGSMWERLVEIFDSVLFWEQDEIVHNSPNLETRQSVFFSTKKKRPCTD